MRAFPPCVTALVLAGAFASGHALAEPVKIGLIESLSGPQAASGLEYRAAVRYAVDRINAAGGWNGEPVQLLDYDNQGGPAGAADKVKAAIADGVHMVVQGASSAVGGQVSEDVRKHNLRNPGKELVYINIGAEALELTGARCHFHHFRFNSNAQIRVKVLVQAMKNENMLGTKVYAMNQNYSWGQDMQQAILDNAKAGGYEVVEKTLHDVNKIQDFSPYVAKISASGADTVITGNWSNDLLLLMKATKAAGLKTRFGTMFLDQPGNLANAGETALGHYIAQTFNAESGGSEGDKYARDYEAKSGHLPSASQTQAVQGLLMVGEALKRTKPVKGALNVNAFALALEKVKLPTSMGEVSIRAQDHQALRPMVVSVVSRDAKYKLDNTDMGFKPVQLFPAAEVITPVQASCTMRRPS